ncbi:hypothetical protein [Candidatus Laterigemmans baculatus]|uniref:hypothetical protein n=1 Tax=Candidatus Laterigemmans baculatus TaxID=2770505 RepID=UPI0013DA2F5D|nr:hypothetical protein [Candidatus Laterigemmans baculatus]
MRFNGQWKGTINAPAVRWSVPLGVILSFLCLASAPPVRGSEAIAQWNFSRRDDLNFDGAPDHWKRLDGPAYPRYLALEIRPRDAAYAERMRQVDARLLASWQPLREYLPWLPSLPPSLSDWFVDRYLHAELDGGALQTTSPTVDVFADYNYRLRLRLRTVGLTHNEAWAELVFYDAAGEELRAVESQRLGGTTEWSELQIGPIPPPASAAAVAVRLRLEPGATPDITGSAGFDDLRVDRLPRIRTEGDVPLGIYASGDRPRVRCLASGLPSQVTAVRFSLQDEMGRELQAASLPLHHQFPPSPTLRRQTRRGRQVIGFGGEAEWQLPPLSPGFYRVKLELDGYPPDQFDVAHTLAVLGELPGGRGPFGWSLLDAEQHGLPPKALPDWLAQCHVSWVKYPCWTSPDDPALLDELGKLLHRFRDRGIEPVGVLAAPPPSVCAKLAVAANDPAAILFRDPSSWSPLLEPVMARLSPEVQWWQLGEERDYSFLGRTQLSQWIADIRSGLQGYGHPVNLVLSWPWLETLPPESSRSWEAVCLSDALPPTAAEIAAYIAALDRSQNLPSTAAGAGDAPVAGAAPSNPPPAGDAPPRRPWILLDPLPADRYPRSERIRDLILRMLTVRQQQIPAAFVSNPFDPQQGLLRGDGTPGEMLLPWRTAAALLGPLRPIGSIELPAGSQNVALIDETRAMLVLWSDSPRTEVLYLGDEVRQIDAWGRTREVEEVQREGRTEQRIEVGTQPTFLVGVDRNTLLWRMSIRLEPQRIDSLLGREQTVRLHFQNPAPGLLNGSFRIRPPATWNVGRFSQPFVAEPYREQSEPFALFLRSDATIGRQPVAIDFELEGDAPRRFTVWRHLEIGPEDVQVEVTTRLLSDGRLLVRPELSVEAATPQRFDCYIYAPGRQRLRRGLTVPARSAVRQEFFLENGEQLIGQELLLRAEQQGLGRTLNYRFTAER